MGSPEKTVTGKRAASSNREYARGLARAAAGAMIFAFPLLMTMEMWWLGFYLPPLRLFLFLLLTLILLVPLSRFVGFERTDTLLDDVLDGLVVFAIGAIISALLLAIFGIITVSMPASEIIGKIAVQTAPASIGAALARGQFGGGDSAGEEDKKAGSYHEELFLMLVGALFLAFNVAPTEEMILIAFKMTPWHALALIFLSILVLHAFVYALGFRGQEPAPEGSSIMQCVINFSIVGYGIALLVSLYVLWTFGRTDGASLSQIAMMTVVLGFPSALGAASARLIV